MSPPDPEIEAYKLTRVVAEHFNPNAQLPYGCTVDHIRMAMNEFLDFLESINQKLVLQSAPRLESILMPANFSSMVGEYCGVSIAKHCPTLVKNRYHNGHPDLIPAEKFPENSVQHANEGIEIKASRYASGWQGHNVEECWLLVFVFDSNRPVDPDKRINPKPFQFQQAVGAKLDKNDWLFAGRSETSRRTITASVTASGHNKMTANWIYRLPDDIALEQRQLI